MHVRILGSGPRIVLVHGSVVGGRDTWLGQEPLTSRYTLVIPDRPGFPPNPDVDRVDFEDHARQIAELLEDGDHLVGQSYGGLICLHAAAIAPPLRSLTVIEPPAFGIARGRDGVDELVARLDAHWATSPRDPETFLSGFLALTGSTRTASPGTLTPELAQGVRALIVQRSPVEADPPLEALAERPFPKLVVSGGHSEAFDAVCDVLGERMRAERAVVTGARHGVPRAATAFNELLERFLDRARIRFPIEAERLFLRPFAASDTAELHGIWGDPAAARFGGDWPRPESADDTRRYLEPIIAGQAERGYSSWAVIERGSGRLIGDCGLFPADEVGPEVELAYGLAPDVWGRGYATEAAAASLRAAFDQLGLERVVADVDPANAASIRVLERIGMQLEREAGGKRFYAAQRSAQRRPQQSGASSS